MSTYRSSTIATRFSADRALDAAFGMPRSDQFSARLLLGNEPKNHQRMLPVRLESPIN